MKRIKIYFMSNKYSIILSIISTILILVYFNNLLTIFYNYKYPKFCFKNKTICINKPNNWNPVMIRVKMNDNLLNSSKSWFTDKTSDGVVLSKNKKYIEIYIPKQEFLNILKTYKDDKMKLIPCYKNYHCFIFKEEKLKGDKSIFVYEKKLLFTFWEEVGEKYMSKEKSLKLLEEILKE